MAKQYIGAEEIPSSGYPPLPWGAIQRTPPGKALLVDIGGRIPYAARTSIDMKLKKMGYTGFHVALRRDKVYVINENVN